MVIAVRLAIELRNPFPDLRRRHTNDRVGIGVVGWLSPEDFGPDNSLAQQIRFPSERRLDNEPQERRIASALAEVVA